MDGDDGPRHKASFGIPAYMIAYLESPIHLSDSIALTEEQADVPLDLYLNVKLADSRDLVPLYGEYMLACPAAQHRAKRWTETYAACKCPPFVFAGSSFQIPYCARIIT
ncbi:MAG TPA: hypothetical protein VK673_07545 [Chthoniobacterales bacterium]|nr:hypothetical protein [Chthoniobacterales bacterium]